MVGHVVLIFVKIFSTAATSEIEVFVDERKGRKNKPSTPPKYVPLMLVLGEKSIYPVIPRKWFHFPTLF
jgi:hypothetical protein